VIWNQQIVGGSVHKKMTTFWFGSKDWSIGRNSRQHQKAPWIGEGFMCKLAIPKHFKLAGIVLYVVRHRLIPILRSVSSASTYAGQCSGSR